MSQSATIKAQCSMVLKEKISAQYLIALFFLCPTLGPRWLIIIIFPRGKYTLKLIAL
jgi:hypothetical protein